MHALLPILRRELLAYFKSPLAYVFITVFLALTGGLTFFLGDLLERGQADLQPFFLFHPWLYLFLMPALGMRLWAEERKTGTLEFLATLPVSPWAAVVGKFLAAWAFAGLALALTFPVWITVNHLGDPDNGVIVAGYLGSWLLAGAFLVISACVSATTSNQVVAFVLSVATGFLFMMTGIDIVQGVIALVAPEPVARLVADLSLLANHEAIQRGVLDPRDIAYHVLLIGLGLVVNTALVELNRGR